MPLYSHDKRLQEKVEAACQTFRNARILLISGPIGSGKTHLAKYVHTVTYEKTRAPFIEQHAATLTREQYISQIFGHRKGAFSDATKDFPGLVGMAANGTLCIDDCSLLGHEIQAGLLRFIQEFRYRPLGDIRERQFQGRLILTSSASIQQLLDRKQLREDFAFRIKEMEIQLPELHHRKCDIQQLIQAFYTELRREVPHGYPLDQGQIANRAEKGLKGNFHELRNLIFMFMMNGKLPDLEAPHANNLHKTTLPRTGSLKSDLKQLEGALIARALEEGNRTPEQLCRALNIGRRALFYKLKEHKLKR